MHTASIRTAAACLALTLSAAPAYSAAAPPAGHLATIGPAYPIQEEDFLLSIQRQLRAAQDNGSLDALDARLREQARERVENPPPVEGVQTTRTPRTYYFDPTITLPQDLRTHEGTLLAPAGRRINPLETVAWPGALLFIDARDPRQTLLAARYLKERAGVVKTVLVAGNFAPLSRAWEVPVYFDQAGLLTQRFGIRQVPALVTQDGKRLRIDEIAVE